MPSGRGVRWGLILGAVLVRASSAEATIDNLKSFKQAYPGKEPKAYTCKVCHEGAMGKATDLNLYGQALKAVRRSKRCRRR